MCASFSEKRDKTKSKDQDGQFEKALQFTGPAMQKTFRMQHVLSFLLPSNVIVRTAYVWSHIITRERNGSQVLAVLLMIGFDKANFPFSAFFYESHRLLHDATSYWRELGKGKMLETNIWTIFLFIVLDCKLLSSFFSQPISSINLIFSVNWRSFHLTFDVLFGLAIWQKWWCGR